jgi:hypothetical protein
MEKQFQPDTDPSYSNNDFYTDRSKKVKDLLLGLTGGLTYCIFSGILVSSFYKIQFLWIALIILYLALIFFFLFIRRYYLSIGLVLLVTVPTAIVGGCMLLIR